MNLFQQDASWQYAASHVQVFKLYPQFLVDATDAKLQAVIQGLQQRNIALAIEFGPIDYTDKALCNGNNLKCGQIESDGGDKLSSVLARLKRLGADLRYLAMDEPLWYGHIVTTAQNPAAAEAPIHVLAANVARQVADAKKYFPNVQIGDIEPVNSSTVYPSDYVAEVVQWLGAYKEATGQPLAFFHSDVAWQPDDTAPDQLLELHRLMQASGIRFGIIYDGNGFASTGVTWTNHAEKRFAIFETDPLMVPDDAIIQTWDSQPLYSLPETKPGTMSYLVDRYAATETSFHVYRTRAGFEGQLTAHGTPVIGAQVFGYQIDDGTLNITSTATLEGTVPAGAVSALIGLRINVECGCAGPANILLDTAKYTDQISNTSELREIMHANQKIILSSRNTMAKNSSTFPVTAGNAFLFSIPMQVPYSSANSGYVAIIFLNSAGNEITRLKLPLQPGQRILFAGPTDNNGQFKINLSAAMMPSIMTFDFLGSGNLRLTALTTTENDAQPISFPPHTVEGVGSSEMR